MPKIANALQDHHKRLVVIACLSVVFAAASLVYLARLHNLLREAASETQFLRSLVLTGGVLLISLHAVSDIGITGMLGAKLASYGAQHDQGLSYMLYLLTYALDSVDPVH